MSKRPEHVKCENCCYWGPPIDKARTKDGHQWAACCRMPPNADNEWGGTRADHFCGEFRAEWPVEDSEVERLKRELAETRDLLDGTRRILDDLRLQAIADLSPKVKPQGPPVEFFNEAEKPRKDRP